MDIIDAIGVKMATLIKEIANDQNALVSLRKGWFLLLILQALLLATGTMILLGWWDDQYAIRWLGLAALSSMLFLGNLWRSLKLNTRPGEDDLLAGFGPGNLLTILRGLFLALLIGFLFSPRPPVWLAWVPGSLYSIVAIADLFDGYLARKFDHQTLLGEKLDLSLDGLGMLFASLLLVQYGQVPAWYLLVGFARYLYLAGIWLLRRIGRPVYDLRPNASRRPFAGAQMGFVAVVLFPVFGPPGTVLAAGLFAVPFLIGFTIDWLQVSGMIPSIFLQTFDSKDQDQASERDLSNALATYLPLGFRISLVILMSLWIVQNFLGRIILEYLTAPYTVSNSIIHSHWLVWLLLIIAIGTLMIALGAAGRIAALIVLFGVGLYVNNFGLNITETLLVIGAAGLLYLGTGPYSLWNPEHKLITQRIGEL
jgi:CDP-diacylglycerol--glycerol-3-phosphate 3-phosphatidyltransferase